MNKAIVIVVQLRGYRVSLLFQNTLFRVKIIVEQRFGYNCLIMMELSTVFLIQAFAERTLTVEQIYVEIYLRRKQSSCEEAESFPRKRTVAD